MAGLGGLGFFAGGLSQGYDQSAAQTSLSNYRTEELKIQQQAQQNEQERAKFARIDKSREEMWGVIQTTIDHAKNAGQDNTAIAQLVQPLIQPLKKLAKTSGMDDTIYDAQLAALLARPTPFDVMGGGRSSATARAPATAPNGGAQPAAAAPSPAGGSTTPQAQATDDIDRLTRAMAISDDPGLRQAFAIRLQDAMKQRGDSTEVKMLKDDNGAEHILFVDPRRRTITDAQGNPYVPPSGDDSDTSRIATAIREGRQPPTTTGLYRNAKAVRADLEREGFNLSEANLQWQAAQTQVHSLNAPQMVRYAGLAKSVLNTIDEVKGLAVQMDNSGVPLANKAKIAAYIQTSGNTEGGQLAAKYVAAVNTLKEEFTNLAQGGYAPTEAAWTLANQQVNADYGVKELNSSLTEVQRLLRYRLQGIPNFQTLGPGGTNRYVPGGGQGGEQPQSGDGWSVQRVQ
jgi:hypothetical protein